MDTIENQLKEIMGYSAGPQKVCENCAYLTYSDEWANRCEYNRAFPFQVVPHATCKCFSYRPMVSQQESPAQ